MGKRKLGYIFGSMDSEEKRESRGEAGEAKEKREKTLSAKSAPSDLGRWMEDLTEENKLGDVAGCFGQKLHGYD